MNQNRRVVPKPTANDYEARRLLPNKEANNHKANNQEAQRLWRKNQANNVKHASCLSRYCSRENILLPNKDGQLPRDPALMVQESGQQR